MVDLAGSERLKKSNVSTENKEETIAINSSLTTLGKCILLLDEKKNNLIPYRESKLTKILMESLNGNSWTSLIINLSINYDDIDETLNTLSFGTRACKIQCKPLINNQIEFKQINEIFHK